MEDVALIYVYRNWYSETVFNDQANPVVASIATFRAFDQVTPIYVLDSTEHYADWSDLPQVLNFQVTKKPHVLQPVATKESGIYWQLLSKPLDVYELVRTLPQTTFMVCDSDILFLQSPWPLFDDPEKHFVCGHNTGLYYFHKSKPTTAQLFETWGALGTLAIGSLHFRRKVISPCWNVVQEESVFRYMARCHGNRLHILQISPYENFDSNLMIMQQYDSNLIKMLHLCSTFGRPNRGRAALAIEEAKQLIKQTLSNEYVQKVFDGFECPSYSIREMERDVFVDKVRKAIGNDRVPKVC